ncbi:MAG TPA: helix-turn-helix transcriptional regulator [Myxococcales bacterium]|jgi:transcriptional regulator with XRE-family HTH domain|nr:helix-turn-helix transcriptional regulator [Myxococcales bacterium]
MAKKKAPELPNRPRRKLDKGERELIKEIAAAILKMRKSSGLTLEQLAKMGGSSASIVNRTERGVAGLRTPDFNRLRQWSKAMGWHMKIVFVEPAPGEKWVQVDKPAPGRKKIVGPVIPPRPQKPAGPDDEFYEPPGAW